jgi:hypothetical protein
MSTTALLSPADIAAETVRTASRLFAEDPTRRLVVIKGSTLIDNRSTSPLHPDEVLGAFDGKAFDVVMEPRHPVWRCHLFAESAPPHQGGFKVYAVVKRPGMLEAVITTGVNLIRQALSAMNVDDPPVHVPYRLISAYRHLYRGVAADTYEQYVSAEIISRLKTGGRRISAVKLEDSDMFECRLI